MDSAMPHPARRSRSRSIPLLIIFLAVVAAGCRLDNLSTTGRVPSSDTTTTDDSISPDGIRISLVAPVFSPPAGDGQLVIRVTDMDDQPVDSAALQIRGDMTHAGMLPIEATAAPGEDGVYRIPVRWTMAGDWIITVEATLSDGRRATRTFDITVTGEEELCIDGPQDDREE